MREAIRFPLVEMEGTPYEMGLQYGRQCRGLIRRILRRFDGLLLSPEHVETGRKAAQQAVSHVRKAAPDLLEETEGIAAGAGLPFEDVFRISCSQELNSWNGCQLKRAVTTVPSGCTTIAAQRDGSALVAWNMDWRLAWQPFLVLLHGRPKDGPRFICVALAGSIGRPGLSEGIAVSANFLPYRADPQTKVGGAKWAGAGVPYSYMSRMLLQQRSTADALALLERTRRMACLNYTLGDATGRICCVETMPWEMAVLEATEGFVTHANSYHAPEFDGLTEEEQWQRDPRAYRAREVLRRRPKPLDRADIHAAQRAHFRGKPTGVCVHAVGPTQSNTLLAFVGDLRDHTLWTAYGPPCWHRFLRHAL